MPIIPKVSILTTAFNREELISETIESVLCSSYENFELIIVDDNSSDKTIEVAQTYKKLDNRIKIYKNKFNLGDYPNRNKAATLAKGKYLKYLDSDDLIAKNCLERMVCEMEKNPECAFGVTSRNLNEVLIHSPMDSFRKHFFERGILDCGPSSYIIKSDIFIKEQGFKPIRWVGDLEFWLRLAKQYPLIEFETNLVKWREHEGQEIKTENYTAVLLKYKIIKEKIEDSSLTNDEVNFIISQYKKDISRILLKKISKIGISEIIKIFQKLEIRVKDIL